ncbi:hypothetical protein ACFSTC_23240 [Nonomuraea ferruginea]
MITMLICTAGFGTAVIFMDRLPSSLRAFGDGIPVLAALAFVVGVLVGWAIRLVRPPAASCCPSSRPCSRPRPCPGA